MTVTVSNNSLRSFLIEQWQRAAPHELDETPNGLCLLEGQIVRQNLQRSLVSESVPPVQAAEYSSIEDFATQIVRAKQGRASLLNRHLHVRLLDDIIQTARDEGLSSELNAFASIERLTDDTYLEELYAELNEYYRCTDAGHDHEDLLAIAAALDDAFARQRSEQTLAAFDAIHTSLQERTAQLPDWVYLSRSHLVRTARFSLSDVWAERFGHIDWIAVATVNVLDNPTLRLFTELATLESGPDIHLFFEEGTRETLYNRLDSVGLDPVSQGEGTPMESEAGEAMRQVATGTFQEDSLPAAVELVEAPDRRREIEHVATAVRERLANGVSADDILVIARNVDQYRPIVEDIFTNIEIPYQVETRRPMAHLSSYRFIKAAVDLIDAAVSDRQDVSHTELIDPLRLGYCHPDQARTAEERWPVADRLFLRLEQQLHAEEQQSGPRSVAAWKTFSREQREDDDDEWTLLLVFLDWVFEHESTPPTTGANTRAFLDELLLAHSWCTATDAVRSPSGPAVDPTRTDIGMEHRTALADRVRNRGPTLETYYDHVLDLFDDLEPNWDLVGQALGDVIGSEPFWSTSKDGNTITVIDAGLVDFRDAAHVFIVGLSAEEFPIELTTPTFIHETLREATAQQTPIKDEEYPYLYYETRLDQYEQDLDSYVTALRTCREQLTLQQFYLDSENAPVSWSPFVDYLDPDPSDDEYVTRIRLDEWLPTPREEESWRETWDRISNRDRLRSYVFQAADVAHTAGPQITQPEFQHLAFRTDAEPLTAFIEPRIDRYMEPIYAVTIDADEPAFDGALEINDIVGGPIRPHELDLFAQCELKFYFYQLLFNFDGDRIERATIPERFETAPTSRFGELPAVVASQQADEEYREGMARVITDLLPDRQDDLGGFTSMAELRDWFERQATDMPQELLPALISEWHQVQLEQQYGVDRDWSWVADPDPVTISGTDVVLPAHRVDSLLGDSLPVYLSREREYAKRALKQCWVENGDPRRTEFCDGLCEGCGRVEDCSYPTKYVLDHRLHTTVTQPDSSIGVLLQEQGQSRPAARRGFVIDTNRDLSGFDGEIEPFLERWTAERYDTVAALWRSDIEHHVRQMRPDPDVEYSTTPEFVTELDGCENCVYRELCQVPIQEERR